MLDNVITVDDVYIGIKFALLVQLSLCVVLASFILENPSHSFAEWTIIYVAVSIGILVLVTNVVMTIVCNRMKGGHFNKIHYKV